MAKEEVSSAKKEFIGNYYGERVSAISTEKRKRTQKLQALRFSLLTIVNLLAILIIIIAGSILLVALSSLNNIEQLHDALNSDGGATREAMETATYFVGSDFVRGFSELYEKKTEFILAFIVAPAALIVATFVGNILINGLIRRKTSF